MKAKLIFNLPEDQNEWDNAVNANAMYSALCDLEQELMTLWKYEELSEDEWKMVARIRNKFFEILEVNNINLNK
jgi:hypothetical protein